MHKFRRAFVALIVSAFVFLVGCFNSTDPNTAQQDEAAKISAALGLGAKALAEGNKLCSDFAENLRQTATSITDPHKRLDQLEAAKKLDHACSVVTHDAEDALELAQDAIDTYNDVSSGYIACAAQRGADALRSLAKVLADAGAPVPAKIEYGLDVLGPLLKIAGPVCIMPLNDAGASSNAKSIDAGPPVDAPPPFTLDIDALDAGKGE